MALPKAKRVLRVRWAKTTHFGLHAAEARAKLSNTRMLAAEASFLLIRWELPAALALVIGLAIIARITSKRFQLVRREDS